MKRKTFSEIIIIFIVCILSLAGFYLVFQSDSEINEDISSEELNGDISSEKLLDSVKIAGDYLVNVTNEDGSFVYEYNASNDWKSSSYNMLRHAGTIY